MPAGAGEKKKKQRFSRRPRRTQRSKEEETAFHAKGAENAECKDLKLTDFDSPEWGDSI